jgi:hypothetical protein
VWSGCTHFCRPLTDVGRVIVFVVGRTGGRAAVHASKGLDAMAAGYRSGVAITATREVVIDATPDEIMDVLVDLESLTEWSSAHQKVEVLEQTSMAGPAGHDKS